MFAVAQSNQGREYPLTSNEDIDQLAEFLRNKITLIEEKEYITNILIRDPITSKKHFMLLLDLTNPRSTILVQGQIKCINE